MGAKSALDMGVVVLTRLMRNSCAGDSPVSGSRIPWACLAAVCHEGIFVLFHEGFGNFHHSLGSSIAFGIVG